MGYENRDYFRDGSYSRTGSTVLADAPMCRNIIIATVGLFIVQFFFVGPAQTSIIETWFALDVDKVLGGQIWRVLTSAFLHSTGDPWHIVINMLVLFWFGRTVETTYGSREFLLIYSVGAICSSLAYISVELLTANANSLPAIGASGAVFAVTCIYVMWFPRTTIMVNFFIPLEARFLLILYVIFDLHPVLLQLRGYDVQTGTAHASHLGGLLFGFLYFRNNWKLESTWHRLTRGFSHRPRQRTETKSDQATVLEMPPKSTNSNTALEPPTPAIKSRADEKFDSKINEILDKIAKDGEASLTSSERKILLQGSKRYRDR